MKIAIPILFIAIFSMIFSGINSAQGQLFLSNEIPKPDQGALDPRTMDFWTFLQYMKYYEEYFGKDYVLKVYKEYHNDDDDDDDDDDKKKKHHHDKDWWKHNSKDHDWKDKKKYCEGAREFEKGKCVPKNDDDKTAYEDALCDDPDSDSKICGNNDDDDEDKEDDENENDNDIKEQEEPEEEPEEQEQEDPEDEPEEQEEPEEEEDDSEDDEGDGDNDDGDSEE